MKLQNQYTNILISSSPKKKMTASFVCLQSKECFQSLKQGPRPVQ